jgi:hypothetical protein
MPFSQYMSQGVNRNPPYGIPTTLMQGINTSPSLFSETMPGVYTPLNQHLASSSTTRNGAPPLTNTSLMSLRQQMDESDNDMVNMLTQQIGTVFNPLIQNTNQTYHLFATQMGRMADFFGAPHVPNQPVPQIQNIPIQNVQIPNDALVPVPNNIVAQPNFGQPQVVPVEPQAQLQAQPQVQPQVEPNPPLVLVNRNQNADEVVRNVQQNNLGAQNNIANLVEAILVQNGLNIGLHRPNFVSALSEYVL